MKLLIKILLFVLVALVTNVNETSTAIIFPNIQEPMAYSSFHLNNKECKDSEKFLHEFNKGLSDKLPPSNSNLFMFFKLDDKSIIKINNIELYTVYKKEYKDKYSFNDYLCSLFNEKLYLKRVFFNSINNHYQIIKPNENIEKLELEELINKFCLKTDNHLKLKNQLNDDIKVAVLYTFFKNKNYISFDDYEGYYLIKDSL